MAIDPNTSIHSPSAPTWQNWSGNLVHKPSLNGMSNYFMPTNLAELKSVVAQIAKIPGATLRVTGQRHSQPPLVIEDNRDAVPETSKEFLVDMSCYTDLGPDQDQSIVLGPGKNQVVVNSGIREDQLDAFLTSNNLMMKTVTAGGFFSLGGMTAVDVHGATMDAPIFAETVSSFTILLADGTVTTIDTNSPTVDGWSTLQFARVSLGGLGIVTSLVLNVLDRPFATTLKGGTQRITAWDKSTFVQKFKPLLQEHTRVEIFFTPYAASWYLDNFLVLWWDVISNPSPVDNIPTNPASACILANQTPPQYGAPYLGFVGKIGAYLAEESQYYPWRDFPGTGPSSITAIGRDVIESDGNAANLAHSDLWLNGACAVIFMSYFIPLPNIEEEGLEKVWESLDVVTQIVLPNGNFHIAAPMEFRFVKAGNSAMSGTYSDNTNAWFVNQDLIAFVKPGLKASQYPEKLLKFFADVERQWVAMGGFPHNGKMYGFYDPTAAAGSYSESGPFNPKFLTNLRKLRGPRLEAFNAYRKKLDSNGLFYNDYLKKLLE